MIVERNGFIHHVFFWLKDPENSEGLNQLIEGLQKLSKAAIIKDFHIGVPAATNREVIDSSYAVSWLLLFDNKGDQDSYQTDPMHLKFIEECSHLWNKVVVYDTIAVK
jgi:Stress responsive A/B Barrel Domain